VTVLVVVLLLVLAARVLVLLLVPVQVRACSTDAPRRIVAQRTVDREVTGTSR
jgi:hypothetical protein